MQSWSVLAGHLCVFANGSGDLTMLMPPIGEAGDGAGGDAALKAAFELMDAYNADHGVPDRSRISDATMAVARIGDGEPNADKEASMVSIRVGSRGSEALIEVVRALDASGVETRGLAMRRPSLDDVFLGLTGHAAEEEDPGGRRRGRRGARPRNRQGTDMERTAS